MKFKNAMQELKDNININFAHAALLYEKKCGFYTELHAGHAGNCCCDSDNRFVWCENSSYTNFNDMKDQIAAALETLNLNY
jgi:hypothetical protein